MSEAEILDRLAAWVREGNAAVGPITFGVDDCALGVASWWMVATGNDIAAGWRGRYGTAEDVRAMMRGERGGFVGAMRRHLAAIGLVETGAPAAGDIAIVRMPAVVARGGASRTALVPTSAVMMPSGRWRVRAERGAVTAMFPVLAAWSLRAALGAGRA